MKSPLMRLRGMGSGYHFWKHADSGTGHNAPMLEFRDKGTSATQFAVCAGKAVLYDVGMTLGSRIKSARERLTPKVTQQEIADAFGITIQAVSGWERDEAIPDFDKLSKLRQILRVPLDWLVEGAPPAIAVRPGSGATGRQYIRARPVAGRPSGDCL